MKILFWLNGSGGQRRERKVMDFPTLEENSIEESLSEWKEEIHCHSEFVNWGWTEYFDDTTLEPTPVHGPPNKQVKYYVQLEKLYNRTLLVGDHLNLLNLHRRDQNGILAGMSMPPDEPKFIEYSKDNYAPFEQDLKDGGLKEISEACARELFPWAFEEKAN